jgi:peptidylprolyl isomerase
MNRFLGTLITLALVILTVSCKEEYPDLEDGLYAQINTNQGVMLVELYKNDAPMTVANFVALAEGNHPQVLDTLKGKPFYDGLVFHRVIEGFMIQGGDYTGTGGGSVGYKFPQEVSDSLKHDEKGVLSMANAGPNTNGSQFFIMHKAAPHLDMKYNVFGKVIEGLAVVDSIATTETAAGDRPVEDQIIESVKIIRKGRSAKNFDAVDVFKEEIKKAEKAEEERKENAQKERDNKVAELLEIKKQAKPLERSNEILIHYHKKGDGEKPEEGSRVRIEYAGFLNTGDLFDTSDLDLAKTFDAVDFMKEQRGLYRPIQPEYSETAQMVPGFKAVLLSMNYGDKVTAFIPSHLAYGERANGPIPPNSDLIFEMELLAKQ